MVRTQHFHCLGRGLGEGEDGGRGGGGRWGAGSIPGQGTKICKLRGTAKKQKKN